MQNPRGIVAMILLFGIWGVFSQLFSATAVTYNFASSTEAEYQDKSVLSNSRLQGLEDKIAALEDALANGKIVGKALLRTHDTETTGLKQNVRELESLLKKTKEENAKLKQQLIAKNNNNNGHNDQRRMNKK